jgi:hypothetical protein
MNRFFKTFLIWLLSAVLPLNAVAAVAGLSCASAHRQAMPSLTQHHVAVPPTSHAPDHELAHHPAGTSAHAAAADQAPGASGAGHAAHSTCSACSVFCTGAVAPPPAIAPILPLFGSETVTVQPLPRVAGFIPDGLRRPPRPVSA